MKFCCDKNILMESISIVSKAVSSKSAMPVLECILFSVQSNLIKLTANDLEMGIECSFDADIQETGEVAIGARMIYDIVRSLPDGQVQIFVDTQSYRTVIDAGSTHFEIKALPGDEFPQIPKIEKESSFTIPSNQLKAMIRQTIFAVGTNENRFILTGSLFEINDNLLKVVSVDGFRMAIRKNEIEPCGIYDSFVIPGKTLSELSKLLPDSDELVRVFFSDKNVLFEIDNYIVISRLLEGEFLNYEQILPKTNEIRVFLDAVDFLRCLERTALIITASDQNNCPSVLKIEDHKVEVSCHSSMGEFKDAVLANIAGGSLQIGFNHKYLSDALKACENNEISLEFNTHLSPCVIRPKDGSDQFIYIVLPVRLKNE